MSNSESELLYNMPKGMIVVEEDGDEIFTKMPKKCVLCGGKIKKNKRCFYECKNCKSSYGK